MGKNIWYESKERGDTGERKGDLVNVKRVIDCGRCDFEKCANKLP